MREDVETFGRHATVRFGRDWKRDAERRDFTMNALLAFRRRHRARPRRRACGSRAPPCALHRRRGDAHPRGLSAHPALLPLPRLLRRRRARSRPGCTAAIVGARRARAAVARARAHGADEAPARAARGRGARRDGGIRPASAWCSAACRYLASLRQHGEGRSRARPCAGRDAQARRARRLDRRGCRAAVAAVAAVQCRARAACRDGDGLVARFAREWRGAARD